MKYIFFLILNKSPLFSLSCDDFFGEIMINFPIRFSVARITIGLKKIYILTYSNHKFQFYYILNLRKLRPWPKSEFVEKKLNSYEDIIKNIDDNKIRYQIQFLERKIGMDNDTLSLFHTKTSFYCAIAILLIGYLVHLIQIIVYQFNWSIESILPVIATVFSLIYLYNFSLFIYEYSKNKNVSRSSFSDLKYQTSLKKLSLSCYFDWFNIKEEVQVLSTYVKNIEKYLFNSVISILITSILLFFLPYLTININSLLMNNVNLSSLSLIDENNIYSHDKIIKFTEILKNIGNNNISTIYVIKTNNINNDITYKQIIDSIKLFSDKTKIIFLDITDNKKNMKLLILKPSYR
ncbi:MAG: hypothetical protein PHI97_05160 [Desulfobulbus sp.]|nr:hypothetical protein [Desulfobulbus sp.]